MERIYPSDLTDKQWQVLRKLLLKKSGGRGRPPLDCRRVINAIPYLTRTGCQWRQLPEEFPHWKSVYTVIWRWKKSGVWKRIHDALRKT
jgi:transposase